VSQLPAKFDDFDVMVEALSDAVLELVDEGKLMPIVLIDGRAGSGKSTLADALQRRLFKLGESLPRVIHMDDLYPGWDGLSAGADYLQRFVLNPLSRREVASWQVFDWAKGERDEWREFGGGTPLIIEGCGSLNALSSPLADFSVWLDVPQDVRFERWVNREGNDSNWAKWAAQEADFYAREKSDELATQYFIGL
jgi:uridine kinase